MHNRINSALCTLCSPPCSHFHFKEVPIFHKDVPLKQAKPSALAQSHYKSGWWSPELHSDLTQSVALRYSSQLSSAWESWLGRGRDTSYLCHHPDWFTLTDLAHKRVPMQGGAAQSLFKLWLLSKDVVECAWQPAWHAPMQQQISHDALTKFSTTLAKEHFSVSNSWKPQPHLTVKIGGLLYCSQGNVHAWQRKCTSHLPDMSFTFTTEASLYPSDQSVECLHSNLHSLPLDIKATYKEKRKSFSEVKNVYRGGSRYVLR